LQYDISLKKKRLHSKFIFLKTLNYKKIFGFKDEWNNIKKQDYFTQKLELKKSL
jgi:hypothetical protein